MKKVIAILMAALLFGCGSMTTPETGTNCQNTESEVTNMIKNKNYIKVAQVDKNVLEVDNDIISLQDAQDYLDYYLSQGYALYDIHNGGTTPGFSRLTGVASAKVVCVWVGTMASATYSVQTGYLTGKTNVIVLNVCINDTTNKKVISKSSGNYIINFDSGTNFSSYGLKFCLFTQINGLKLRYIPDITGINFNNCHVGRDSVGGPISYLYDCEFEYCIINPYNTSGHPFFLVWNNNKKFNNVKVESYNTSGGVVLFRPAVAAKMVFKNCLFYNMGNDITFDTGYYADFYNSYFYGGGGGNINLFTTKDTTTSVFALQPCNIVNTGNYPITFINAAESAALIAKPPIKFVSYAGPLGDYTRSGSPVKLAIAQLPPTMTTFYRQSCLVKTEYRGQSTPAGYEMRQYYNLDFLANYFFYDALKNWTLNKYWLVKREDCEAVLLTAQKYIKGLAFYSNAGATTPYTYTNDENVIIRATNATTGETHFFIWYNGELRKTVYSNPQADTIYTVEAVFQIWKPESFSEILNSFEILTNAPVTGSGLFNNMDNEVVR